MATLADVTSQLKENNNLMKEQNTAFASDIGKGLAKNLRINDVISNITSPITNFPKAFATSIPGFALLGDTFKAISNNIKKTGGAKQVEKDREQARADKKQTSILEALLTATTNGFSSLLKGITKTAGGLFGALLAPLFLLSGFFSQLVVELKYVASLFKKIPGVDKVKNIAGSFITVIDDYFKAIKEVFKKAGTGQFLKASTTGLLGARQGLLVKTLDSIFSVVKKVTEPISNFFGKIKSGVTKIGEAFKTVLNVVAKLFAPVLDGLQAGFNTVKGFATSVGSFLAKLFLPITIIIGIFDSITGFMEDWKSTEGESAFSRFVDAVGGGLGKLVGNLIGIPLDLLKSAVSWIMGKLGFDSAKEILDSFKFADLFRKLIDAPFNFISKAIDTMVKFFTENDVGNKISSIFSGSLNVIENFFKKILRTILPIGDENGNWYDIKNLISKAIPDAVYEYAGLNPKTGEMTALDEPQLNLRTEDIEALSSSREMQKQGDVVINNVDQSVNSQTSQNNSMLSGNYIDPDGRLAENTY